MSILTLEDLIQRLLHVQSVYGNLPVCVNDSNVGYLQGLNLHLTRSTLVEKGIYDHPKWIEDDMGGHTEESGEDQICVIEWVGTE